MEWINVDKKLPEINDWVLCSNNVDGWTDLSEINIGRCGNIVFWNRECEIFPTHWMPLPEPSKQE